MMIYRQKKLETILTLFYFTYFTTNAFENQQMSIDAIENNSRLSMSNATSTPSQTPHSTSPFSSNDDDWYYAYHRRPHTKRKYNIDKASIGATSNETISNDCFDRYGRGALGQLACRGKVSKSNMERMKMKGKEKSRMMMKGMSKNKAPKSMSKMCNGHKAAKSCLVSTMPSIVPSSVPQSPSETPKNQFTDVPDSKETALPTRTNVPSISSSPTFSTMPSSVVSQYPTFESTQQKTPSLPPISSIPIILPSKMGTQQPTLRPSNHPTMKTTARPSSATSQQQPSLAPSQQIGGDLFQRATPFGLTYGHVRNSNGMDNGSSTVAMITAAHISDVRDTTIEFLEDYLDEQLFGNTETIVDFYVSNIESIGNSTGFLPALIVYGFGIVFQNSTTFILTQQEVDVLIESGFRTPFVDVLISTLQQLDRSNPFSSTTSVVYTQKSDLNITKNGRAIDDLNMSMTEPPIKLDLNNTMTEPPVQIDDRNTTVPPVRVEESMQSFDAMMSKYEQAAVKVTPFTLTYKWSGRNDTQTNDLDPTIGELRAASNISLSFLDHYLHTMLDLSQPGAFTYFVGYSAGIIHQQNVIEFRTALQFQEMSMFSSIQNEVDMIIQTAFIPHYVEPLIEELRSKLPRTNPFSKTVAIVFAFRPPKEPTSNDGLPIIGIVTMVMAILLFVIVTIFIVLYRYQKWNRIRRQSGIPKFIVHSNHDPIHGDLIEIITSEEPDDKDVNQIPTEGLSSTYISMHQQLLCPLTTIEYIDDNNDENSTIGSVQYKTAHQSKSSRKPTYSDGWSSTSSSTSALSVTVPLKYTEPKIFEDVD